MDSERISKFNIIFRFVVVVINDSTRFVLLVQKYNSISKFKI